MLPTMTPKTCWRIGAVLGALGVAIGAFGAHGLEARLTELGTTDTFVTGSRYHLLHALALLATGMARPGRAQAVAGVCFTVGVLVFSGSVYALALGAPRVLGAVAPIGGTLLILGWLALSGSAARAAASSS